MRKVASLFLALMLISSVFSVFPQSTTAQTSGTSESYEKSWLGYELTKYMNGTSSIIPLTGGNGTLMGVWNGKPYGFVGYDPCVDPANQSVRVYVSFGGFLEKADRENWVRNALVLYGERNPGSLSYNGYNPHKVSYYGFYDPYMKLMVFIVNITKTEESPPNELNPYTIWISSGHNANVTWDESRSAYIVEPKNDTLKFPHIVFGTPTSFLWRHMINYTEHGFWWNVYQGGGTKTGWGANDTFTFMQANDTSYVDMGLQFRVNLTNVGDSYVRAYFVAFGDTTAEALDYYDQAVSLGYEQILNRTVSYWRSWLNQGPALSSSDLPWLGEWINQTLLGIMGTIWKSPEGYRQWASWQMYKQTGWWWDAVYPFKALLIAGHYDDVYNRLEPWIKRKDYSQVGSPNDFAWDYGYLSTLYYMLWRLSGNDTITAELYPYFKAGWENLTANGWDSTHNLFKNRGGLDHPLRYYASWAGDGGWYTCFNFPIVFGLHGLSEIAEHLGYSADAASFENYSQLILSSLKENMWNGTAFYLGRHGSNWSLARGYTLYEAEAPSWGWITPRLYIHIDNYVRDWWEGRSVKFPYHWEQDSGGTEQNAVRSMTLGGFMDALLMANKFNEWRSIINSWYNSSPRPFIIGSETVNVNASDVNSGNPNFVWSLYIGPNALKMAERHSDGMVYIHPAVNFTVRWPDGTKIIVTRYGNDSLPLTEYAVNGSRVQVTGWDRQINFTITSGKTYLIDVYFGSRPALTNLVQELEFFNRTEVWNAAEKELNITFTSGLPSSNRVIMIYCDTTPSNVEGGVLINCSNSLAAISLSQSSITIKFAPAEPPSFYVWGAAAAAGGVFVYWLYRKKRK